MFKRNTLFYSKRKWWKTFKRKPEKYSSTRHFIDTSVAACSLNMSLNDLLNNPKMFGFMFEDFVLKNYLFTRPNIANNLKNPAKPALFRTRFDNQSCL
ncbi:MAG: hypothetical protein SOY02_00435 [Candidatus Onthovivens sp.]|nr:hypothetical protein [Candidatus Onthovivens sp.]